MCAIYLPDLHPIQWHFYSSYDEDGFAVLSGYCDAERFLLYSEDYLVPMISSEKELHTIVQQRNR